MVTTIYQIISIIETDKEIAVVIIIVLCFYQLFIIYPNWLLVYTE